MEIIGNFVISFGALQGLIIGLFLAIKSIKLKQENLFLSLLFVGFAAMLGRIIVLGIYENQSSLFINLNFVLLISPAFYVYSKTASSDSNQVITLNYKHFLPFVGINLGYVFFYFGLHDSVNYFSFQRNLIRINEGLSLVYFLIYFYLTHKVIKQNKETYSNLIGKLLSQIEYIFLGFIIVWISYVVAELTYFNYTMELIYYYPMMLILAVSLYFMSLKVILNTQALFDSSDTPKRKTILLEESESKQLLNRLTHFMNEEKPFLDGGLSLISLATSLDVNPKTLSFVINEHIQKNFNDYINDWRIEEVKERLNDTSNDHLKMLTIAFDCGFNSKSTFNLAFKKSTGLSPSEFRNR